MFGESAISEYVDTVEPVLVMMVDQLEPPLDDLSILYPVIGEPPLFVGAVHDKLICDDEDAVAVNPVGGNGEVMLSNADACEKLIIIKTALRAIIFPSK